MTNFIYQTYLKDISICDELIDFHKTSESKEKGRISRNQIDTTLKSSTDVTIWDFTHPVINKYCDNLQDILNEYIEAYSYCNYYAPFNITEPMSIQHYKPGEAFYAYHTERGSAFMPSVTRHLVFMTYLNDIDDEGGTEFFYQKLKVKPKKGLTLIWPADWTHTHKGIPSETQDKYVITGWYNYI